MDAPSEDSILVEPEVVEDEDDRKKGKHIVEDKADVLSSISAEVDDEALSCLLSYTFSAFLNKEMNEVLMK